MTTPAQPDTGAGAAPDTGSAPETTPTDQQPEPPATDDTDWQAEAEKWKTQARKHEERAKASKKALDQATATKTGEPTLEDLQAKLTEHQEARATAEAKATELAYKDTVRSVATTANLDAEALLDSDSFRRKVAEEAGEDPTDDDVKAAVAKVAKTKAFAASPRFARTVGASRSGGEFPGGPSSPTSIDHLIAAAEKDGDWKTARQLKSRRMLQQTS